MAKSKKAVITGKEINIKEATALIREDASIEELVEASYSVLLMQEKLDHCQDVISKILLERKEKDLEAETKEKAVVFDFPDRTMTVKETANEKHHVDTAEVLKLGHALDPKYTVTRVNSEQIVREAKDGSLNPLLVPLVEISRNPGLTITKRKK